MKKTDFVRDLLRESTDLNKKLLSLLFHVTRSSMMYISVMHSRDEKDKGILETIHGEHPWYGHRRIAWTVGWCMNKTRRLMKKFGILAKVRKRRNFTKKEDRNTLDMHGIIPTGGDRKIMNYLARLCPIAPNIVWRSDFTHIIYRSIHLYLATILDDYTKEIIGYTLSYRHTKEFVLSAIQEAITKTGGVIPEFFHSDQGSEYTSYMILEFLQMNHIAISMSSKGSPWQNGAQESYYGKLKLELGDTKEYGTIEELILAIHRQIYYYNMKRMHTALKDTPSNFRKRYEQNYLLLTGNMKESSEGKK